jgi:hypothetical protein
MKDVYKTSSYGQVSSGIPFFIEEKGCIGCIVCSSTPVFKNNRNRRQSRPLAESGAMDGHPGILAPHRQEGGGRENSSRGHFMD